MQPSPTTPNPEFTADHSALIRFVAALIAMVDDALVGSRLERWTYNSVARLLRPAESAARRLILTMACGLTVKIPKYRPKPRREPIWNTYGNKIVPGRIRWVTINGLRQLITLKQGERYPVGAVLPGGKIVPPPPPPKFKLLDAFRHPRKWRPGMKTGAQRATSPRRTRGSSEAPDASRILARIGVLKDALDNLPKQAQRLARWQARQDRDRALSMKTHVSVRFLRRIRPALRPGDPPGARSYRAADYRLRDIDVICWGADRRARQACTHREAERDRLAAEAEIDTS